MIYDYDVTLDNGEQYSMAKYRGKPLVIVNTATKCGFAPQFKQLEALYERYKDQGLTILGFPSNQFKQELADGAQAAEACRMTYGVSFPMHSMTVVNGDDAAPLFKYLKHEAPGALGESIKWNFCKFLVDRDGNVVERFAPKTNPEKMVPAIEKVL
ncbi:glutathione peroxidase [Lacticaseibacillus jixiensis]|uniref:glutathione peroxidase n=1 Tax=Lacticaseibacillus jixiensis TaxID=3231926 RepID=UPI0036F40BBE